MQALIVKTSSLGDIVHAFPVAQYLKSKGMQVHWVVEESYRDLVKTHPCVDRVIPANTKAWRKGREIPQFKTFVTTLRSEEYDVVFDLQGNIKSGLITALAKSPEKVGFNRECVPEWPNLMFTNRRYATDKGENIRQDYLRIAASWFNEPLPTLMPPMLLKIDEEERNRVGVLTEKGEYKLLVCPGSAWMNKRVSTQTLKEFLQKVEEQHRCHLYFAWGSKDEKEAVEVLAQACVSSTVLPKVSLPVLQNVMDKMHCVIAMDSLPLHLAGTTSAATFSVFGPSSSEKYAPQGSRHCSVQGKCPYGKTFDKRCPILRTCPTGACIHSLSADDLLKIFNQTKQGVDKK